MCLSKTLSTSRENNFIVPFIYLNQNTQTICCFLARSQLNILGPILSTTDSSWDGQRVQKHDTFRTPPPTYISYSFTPPRYLNLLFSNQNLSPQQPESPPQQHESPLQQRNWISSSATRVSSAAKKLNLPFSNRNLLFSNQNLPLNNPNLLPNNPSLLCKKKN